MATMGHGDELVLADAHFPGNSMNHRIIRADGLKIADLLAGILPLFELDAYVNHPLIMMQVVEGDKLDHDRRKKLFEKYPGILSRNSFNRKN
jgi:L-fucose mutarotase